LLADRQTPHAGVLLRDSSVLARFCQCASIYLAGMHSQTRDWSKLSRGRRQSRRMGREEMRLMCGGGLCVSAVWVLGRCTRLPILTRLPAQVVVQQPDQHHCQRDFFWTDGAYSTVRRGALGWADFVACCLVFAWMWGAEGSFPLVQACFPSNMALSPHFCLFSFP
jgi:hypothetical protein